MTDAAFADVLERLFAKFEKSLSLTTIERVARKAADDLCGQIHTEAAEEMLERLASQRLDELARRPPDQGG